jgi:hypothetical protein
MDRHAWVFAFFVVFCTSAARGASLALALSSNPAVYGTAVTLTATVTPPSATGKVTFYDGTAILGIAPISAGVAVLKTTQISYGSSSLNARYSGDAQNAAAFSPMIGETISAISDSGYPTLNPNPTPANVNFIATADFNGDGNLDMVLTMVDQVMILLGNGNGLFTPGLPFSAGNVTAVTSVAVGDFNGDGIPDLAITDYADTTPGSANFVWILLGYGDGQFSEPAAIPVNCAPVMVQVADFNRDGIADLVIVGTPVGTADVSVLLGNGNGTFRSSLDAATANAEEGAIAVAVGDFNGDGIPDLAVLDSGLSILLGKGDGTFGPPESNGTGNTPIGVSAGDFNRDGITDLVVANNVDGTVSILLGKGNGQFQTQTPYAVQSDQTYAYPSWVTVGDFNGDNIPDIAVANYEDGQASLIAIMLGTGNGAFESPVAYPGGAGAGILVEGDFNNDGAIDLAAADGNGSTAKGNVGVLIATRCYFGVSAPPLNFDANGGNTSLDIDTTAVNCGWSAAVTPAGWAFLSATSGFGGGQVNAVISENTSGAQRSGSFVVSGETLAVTQWSTVQLFGDVTTADYYFDAVNLLAGKNITQGCSPRDYCPATSITRAEMAVFIVRAIYGGSDNFPYSTDPYFADVSPSDFGFKWIQHMFELGITSGCGSNLFCPNDTVTRAQMAVFVIRARYGANTPFTSPAAPYFEDVPEGSFAYSWIQRLREDSITEGCSEIEYCPDNPVTRGDMAIFVMRGAFNALYTGPVIATISPAVLSQGASGKFDVTGTATNFVQGITTLVAVGGVTASDLTVTGPTSFTVTLTAAADAPEQPVSIYLQTGSQEAVLPNGLLVQ